MILLNSCLQWHWGGSLHFKFLCELCQGTQNEPPWPPSGEKGPAKGSNTNLLCSQPSQDRNCAVFNLLGFFTTEISTETSFLLKKKKDTRKILQLKAIRTKFTNCLFKNPWSRYKGAPPAQTPPYPSETPQQCPVFTLSMCTTSTVVYSLYTAGTNRWDHKHPGGSVKCGTDTLNIKQREETPKTLQLPVSGTGASLREHWLLYCVKQGTWVSFY